MSTSQVSFPFVGMLPKFTTTTAAGTAPVPTEQLTRFLTEALPHSGGGGTITSQAMAALKTHLTGLNGDHAEFANKIGAAMKGGTDAVAVTDFHKVFADHILKAGGTPGTVTHALEIPILGTTALAGGLYTTLRGGKKLVNEGLYAAGIKDRPVTQNFFVNAIREVLKGQKTVPVLIFTSLAGASAALLGKSLIKQGERKAEQAGQRFEQGIASRVVDELPTI